MRVRKIMFLVTSVLFMVLVCFFSFTCINDMMNRCLIILAVAALMTKFCTYVPSGRYWLSVIRGLFWGIQLKSMPFNLRCEKDISIFYPKCVTMGKSCSIGKGAVLAPLGGGYPSRIIIGDRVSIGAMDRIASMNEVIIEDEVLFAAFVHITDHSHEYRQIGKPIRSQGVFTKGPVHIKKGAWLAFGCHILSGVTVGEYSVVAANSVVTKDVPPYTVVAGNPARVVKRYNFESNQWENAK